MGPAVNEQQVDECYNRFMWILKNSYHIQEHPCPFSTERMEKLRQMKNNIFKAAIRELFLQQECEDF